MISGGQSGVDRAALDAALAAGLAIGGWCPRGRWAEDGPIDRAYPLRETPLAPVSQRTLWNLRDSDGTLILCRGRPRGGTALTLQAVRRKPRLLVDPDDRHRLRFVRGWLIGQRIAVLNVGGPRASEDPGIYRAARGFLAALFSNDRTGSSAPHT